MLEEIIRWAAIYDEGEGKTILKTKIKPNMENIVLMNRSKKF